MLPEDHGGGVEDRYIKNWWPCLLSGNSTTFMDKRTNLGSDIAADQPFLHPVWIGHLAKFAAIRPHKDWT